MMLLLPSMAAHAQWQKWEPTIGGRFPREAYEDIIMRTTRIMSYLTFMSYTMNHPPAEHVAALRASSSAASIAPDADEPTTGTDHYNDRDWLDTLASVLHEISPSHHNIVSTLMLLSNALFSGHSLPPFLPLPRPYEMTRALLRLSRSPTSASTSDEDEPDPNPLMLVNSRTGHAIDHSPYRARGRGRRDQGLGGLGRIGKKHVLDPENVEKPGYAEFAVLEICSTLVCDDLEGLIRSISGLVGVVDYSYRVGGSESTLVGSDGGAGRGVGGGGKGKVD